MKFDDPKQIEEIQKDWFRAKGIDLSTSPHKYPPCPDIPDMVEVEQKHRD